jgi:hypothetical protein
MRRVKDENEYSVTTFPFFLKNLQKLLVQNFAELRRIKDEKEYSDTTFSFFSEKFAKF